MAEATFAIGSGIVYALSSHDRISSFCVALTLLALLGAFIIGQRLRFTLDFLVASYLNPRAWADVAKRRHQWQFEMKYAFVLQPEHVDALLLELLKRHTDFAGFNAALVSADVPPEYVNELTRRHWGFALPSLRGLVTKVLPNEVFRNAGPYSPEKSPAAIFDELRSLSHANDQFLLMDRIQYYWTLRNLNYLGRLIATLAGEVAFVGVTLLTTAAFFGGMEVFGHEKASVALALRALAAGAAVWTLSVCFGVSLLLITIFRGTGTFSISLPPLNITAERLWTPFTQVGIAAFTTSFVIYGVGVPFLFAPRELYHFSPNTTFSIYALACLLPCLTVFLNHTIGTHILMREAKLNALERLRARLVTAPSEETGKLRDAFVDIRGLHEWPFRASVVTTIIAGVIFPLAVQIILIVSHLKKS